MKRSVILLAAALSLSAAPSQAKWWIFGKSNEVVSLKYLYFNGVSAEDSGPKLTFYRSLLKGGGPYFIGQVSGGRGKGKKGAGFLACDGNTGFPVPRGFLCHEFLLNLGIAHFPGQPDKGGAQAPLVDSV